MKIIVLDTETTGLDILKHEIIQLGYIIVNLSEADNSIKILEEREFLIAPQRIESASPEALRINGYTKDKWRGSVPFSKCVSQIRLAIESCDLMLGQNLNFDLRFIKQSFVNLNYLPPKFPNYIDTKRMAQTLVERKVIKSTSMDKLCEHYKISSDGRTHTALVDCHRTLKVWQRLVDEKIDFQFYTF